VELQREAREKGKGLWGLAAAGGLGSSKSCYIGNLRTKKFHRPDCEWAAKISPTNRVYFKIREDTIRQGCTP